MRIRRSTNTAVMAGLDPAIHALLALTAEDVDARHADKFTQSATAMAVHDDNIKMHAS